MICSSSVKNVAGSLTGIALNLNYSFMKYALTLLFPGANLGISSSLKKKKRLNHRLLGVKSYMDVVFLL